MKSQNQFGLRRLFILVAVVSVILALLHYYRQYQAIAWRLKTRNSFQHIGMTLLHYSSENGQLPEPVHRDGAGNALCSWRVVILSYDETPGGITREGGTRRRWHTVYEQPWNSPANTVFRNRVTGYSYDYFAYEHQGRRLPPDPALRYTNIFAITGPGTAFGGDGTDPIDIYKLQVDGPECDAILAVESRRSGANWMEPKDFDVRDMPRTINQSDGRGISSRYPGGFHVLFTDTAVWFLSNETPFDELAKFFRVDDARKHDREQVLGPYRL